jgi:hypothetical protein
VRAPSLSASGLSRRYRQKMHEKDEQPLKGLAVIEIGHYRRFYRQRNAASERQIRDDLRSAKLSSISFNDTEYSRRIKV